MDNLQQNRKILIPKSCYTNDVPDIEKASEYLNRSYPEVRFIKFQGKFMICEGRRN